MARPASIPVGANRNEAILEIIIEEPHEQEPESETKEPAQTPRRDSWIPCPNLIAIIPKKNFDGLAELLCLHVAAPHMYTWSRFRGVVVGCT